MDTAIGCKHFLSYFDESRSVGETSFVKSVKVLNDYTEETFESCKVEGKGLDGKRQVPERSWRSRLLLVLKFLDELRDNETKVFGVLDCFFEQADVRTGISQNSDVCSA